MTSYVIPTIAGVALMGAPFLWCRLRREAPEDYGISWKLEKKSFAELLVITAAVLLPLTIVSVNWPFESLPRHSTLWRSLNLMAAGTSAAIIEEIFYRGWLLPLFKKRLGAFWAIMFSSGLFALSHIFVADAIFLFAVFFPGCIMGFLRERHGNISTSTLFHAVSNIWAVWFAPLHWPSTAWIIERLP
jgi:membrane protease YdiL (CAAX protease family)